MSRVEEYRLATGAWSPHRIAATRVTPGDVAAAVRGIGTVIPLSYFLGTAAHESNYATNERDTEPYPIPPSWGIYQIRTEEAHDVGLDGADLLSLPQATEVMIRLAEARRHALRAITGLYGDDPPDMCSYLAIGHNQGLHAAMATIQHHGGVMDWAAYKHRNPTIRIVSSGYGDDVRP